jgi:hypothetical protein
MNKTIASSKLIQLNQQIHKIYLKSCNGVIEFEYSYENFENWGKIEKTC